MSSFKNLRMVDNFYQTSSFFPMPLCLIGTLDEKGEQTSFGAYSLVFPYYIAGKDYYAMVLECRNSSNTCKGILRHGKCTINFLPYSKKGFKQIKEVPHNIFTSLNYVFILYTLFYILICCYIIEKG